MLQSLHSAIDAFELREMRRQVEETNNVENYTFDDDDDDLVDENEERAAFQRIKSTLRLLFVLIYAIFSVW